MRPGKIRGGHEGRCVGHRDRERRPGRIVGRAPGASVKSANLEGIADLAGDKNSLRQLRGRNIDHRSGGLDRAIDHEMAAVGIGGGVQQLVFLCGVAVRIRVGKQAGQRNALGVPLRDVGRG